MVSFSNFALFLVSLSSVLSDTKTTSLRGREDKRNLNGLALCPFNTTILEETVAQANSRDIQLTDCSCHEYDDATTTNLQLSYVDSSLGYHGWQVSSYGETYEYMIQDVAHFFKSQEEYDACLQVLRNQCGALHPGVRNPLRCSW